MIFRPPLAFIQTAAPVGTETEIKQQIWDLVLEYGVWGIVAAIALFVLYKPVEAFGTEVAKEWAKKLFNRTKPEPTDPETPLPVKPPEPPKPSAQAAPDLAYPYPLPPNFTGRVAERKMLTEWFTSGPRPVCVVEAIGGMGKSALSWYWLHADVLGTPPPGYSKADPADLCVPEEQRPEGVLFWSFYEREAHFGAFLRRAVDYVGARHASPEKLSDRERLEILLSALAQRRILLILDGFERELRDYNGYRAPYQGDEAGRDGGNDCCDPRAAIFLESAASLALAGRVLITSRLLPSELRHLAGCRHERLESLSREDVVSFFEASGVKGTRAEIGQAVAPYGGHPLSVSLLARAIVEDPEMKGDIRVAGEYTVLNQLKGKSGHDILAVAHNQMSGERRELLSRIAAFRSPMDYEALKAVATLKAASLKSAIGELVKRGLLFREGERYDLHPIVRQYAYDRLSDKEGVHSLLQEYFEARPAPELVESLADLTPAIELYWHRVGAHRFDAAIELFWDRLADPLYYRFGAYERRIELLGALFPDGEDQRPRLSKESDQAWTLNGLANSYSLAGQPRRAVPLFEMQNELRAKADNKKEVARGLRNLADDQVKLGRLEAADGGLRHSIELCREIEDEQSAIGHRVLGWLLAYEGRFAEAEHELETALGAFRGRSNRQSEGVVEALSRPARSAARPRPSRPQSRPRVSPPRRCQESRARHHPGRVAAGLGPRGPRRPSQRRAPPQRSPHSLPPHQPSRPRALHPAGLGAPQPRPRDRPQSPRHRRPLRIPPQPSRHLQFAGSTGARWRQARQGSRTCPKGQGLRLLRRPAALLQTGI